MKKASSLIVVIRVRSSTFQTCMTFFEFR